MFAHLTRSMLCFGGNRNRIEHAIALRINFPTDLNSYPTRTLQILRRQLYALDNDVKFTLIKAELVIDAQWVYKPVFDDEVEILYRLKYE